MRNLRCCSLATGWRTRGLVPPHVRVVGVLARTGAAARESRNCSLNLRRVGVGLRLRVHDASRNEVELCHARASQVWRTGTTPLEPRLTTVAVERDPFLKRDLLEP